MATRWLGSWLVSRRNPCVPVLALLVLMPLLVSCGGSGESTPAAAIDPRRTAQATSLPPTLPADANVQGVWGPVFDWPLIPIHAVLLPDSRVMTYGSRPDGSSTAYFSLDVWDNTADPDAGHLSVANGTGNDIFCGSQLLLPPVGTEPAPSVFMAGGDAWNGVRSSFVGIDGSTVFNTTTNSLAAGARMGQPRWYSSAITLVTGETYIQGGFGGTNTPEVRQQDGSFVPLTGADTSFLLWSYPRNYVMPDGRVFGYDFEGRMYFVDTAGTGRVSARTILPWQYFGLGSSAMFRPGRILQIGGNSNASAVIDVSSGEPVFTPTQSISTVRKLMTATLLADGQVLVTGGSPVWNELPGANTNAEIWNPVTGKWALGAAGARARLYHSSALLLPDATVLTGGGGAPAPVGGNPLGERNVEVYHPPYLFAAGGVRAARPTIASAPDAVEIGKTFVVQASGAGSGGISRVTLVKTGSATHGWNFDQRFLDLPFSRVGSSAGNGSLLVVDMPSRAGQATPGYYMLFVFDEAGVPSVARMLRIGVANAPNLQQAPTLVNPGPLSGLLGVAQSRQLLAADPNGDALVYRAAGLPPGVTLNPGTGVLSGTPGSAGSYDVVVSASDGVYSSSAGFVWTVVPQTALALTLVPTPGASLAGSGAAFAAAATGLGTVEYAWSFGDGSADSAWSTQPTVYKVYDRPGTYVVTLRVRDASGAVISRSFMQTVYLGTPDRRPTASTNLVVEVPVHGRDRLWVVNQDNDSITGFDTLTREKLGEVAVGAGPRSIAVDQAGLLWVSNKAEASISIVDPDSRSVVRRLALPRASQPHGLAMSPTAPQAFVVLEATGQVLRLDTRSYAQTGSLDLGPNVRHVSVAGSGKDVFVTRFITPPLPGESTATVATPADRGGEVMQIDAASMTLTRTIVLAHSDRPDAENQGSGVPNYLGAFTVSPDNSQAYVPSKQDNIRRGSLRNGAALNFQNTVRAVSSRVALLGVGAGSEDLARRIDHDNASVASAAAYDNRGTLLFVALETSREVAVVDAHSGAQIMRFDVGRAPQGLALSADGFTLYVNNFMDRSVGVHDLRPLLTEGLAQVTPLATLAAVASDKLAANVLVGKQFFYDARDPRLARDRYLSCASCHHDGAGDGRVWDMTHSGEGLRNTISLRGGSGGPGRLHWSGNFDEVQDFEAQIRSLAGGTGLMPDGQFNAGTRSQPLGDAKAGISADLDALAAYVQSLNGAPASPHRSPTGAFTASAVAGRGVFAAKCASCHGGSDFSDSRDEVLHDIGTVTAASGRRLGKPLSGIDTPTLRGVWATAPYLHNGAAATLEAAVGAHARLSLTPDELADVLSYTRQIDSDEPAAPLSSANLVVRARATLADKIGALYEVRVNQAVVGAGQLDALGWVELFFDLANLVKDAVVELVFKNDDTVAGEDRNLVVQWFKFNGSTVIDATDPGVLLDAGSGALAFDGLEIMPAALTGGWMPWNAAMRLPAPAPLLTSDTVTVRGRSTLAAGVGALIDLRINGVLVGTQLMDNTTLQDLVFNTPAIAAGDRVDVVFTNDALIGGEDRNLFVESVTVRGVLLSPTAPDVWIDRGSGAQAFDGLDLLPASAFNGWVPWSGALRLVAR